MAAAGLGCSTGASRAAQGLARKGNDGDTGPVLRLLGVSGSAAFDAGCCSDGMDSR